MKVLIISLILLSCQGESGNSSNYFSGVDKSMEEIKRKDFEVIHTLRKKDSTLIGEIYARFIDKDVFDSLYVINKGDTIYSIERNILKNRNGIDLKAPEQGFYGYRIVLKKNDYFVIINLMEGGKKVSDNANIIWDYEKGLLQVEKVP